ncbi:MAG: DUF6171 family protein [Bacillota bacterium]|nr:DUF6171 family protein [Bacillota bacterium]
MESKRLCRRCLAREMPDAEYFQNMYEYIANLDPDIKAPDELYEKRLSRCRECDHLLNGMCRLCGCFVEMRAAISANECPAVHPNW